MGFQIIKEVGLNCVWEGSLNVKEKCGSYFTSTPSVLYPGCDEMHCIGSASSGPATKLSGGEKVVFFWQCR